MNIKQNLLALAAAVLPFTAFAQTAPELSIDFETQAGYTHVGTYDWWEESPFRSQNGAAPLLEGNCLVVDNPDKQADPLTAVVANPSAKVLGFQRSVLGSNMLGARIDLATPYTLGTATKYVHVKMLRPANIEGRVMLIGLGKHNAQAVGATTTWKDQPNDLEQFTVIGNQKPTPGYWSDVVFPIKCAGDVDIYSLVVCVDCEAPHRLGGQDFAVYLDDIIINSVSRPSIALRGDYPVCFDRETDLVTRNDRSFNYISVTTPVGTFVKKANGKMGLTEAFDGFIPVKRGQRVSVTTNFTGSYMHSFVYFDQNNDGRFNEADSKEYVGEKKDANATHTFTIPADQVPGVYRIRAKVDWDSSDPAGNSAEDNFILNNGGGMIDALLYVYDETTTVRITNTGLNGSIVQPSGEALNPAHPRGTALPVKWLPETGFECAGMDLTVGILDGEEKVHSNPQRLLVRSVSYRQFDDDGRYTIPAELLYTDMNIEDKMVELGHLPTPDFYYTSKDPIGGQFRASSQALRVKVKNGWMSLDNADSSGNLKLTTATEPTSASGYWVVCGDDTEGYTFYNVSEGPDKVLGLTGSEGNARFKLYPVSNIPAGVTTRFDYRPSSFDNPYASTLPAEAPATARKNATFRVHGSTNNCWNDRDGFLALWPNDNAFNNDGSSIAIHPVQYDFGSGSVVPPPTVNYFSADGGPYTYWGLKFNTGEYYITETDDAAQLKTAGEPATSWALVGTKESFYLLSSTGRYVGVNGDTKCYSVDSKESATEFAFFNEDTAAGTFVIVRKDKTSTGFNPWEGNDVGKLIGFWDSNAANDKLVFVAVEQPTPVDPDDASAYIPSLRGYEMLPYITDPAQLKSGKYFISVYSNSREGLLIGNNTKNVTTETANYDKVFAEDYVWTIDVDDDGTFTLTSSAGHTISVQGANGVGKHNVLYTDESTTAYDAAQFAFNPTVVDISGVPHWMIHQQRQMVGANNADDSQKLAYLHCNCSTPGIGGDKLRLSYWEGYNPNTGNVSCDKIAFYPARAVYDAEATIYNIVHLVRLAQENKATLQHIELVRSIILAE